MKAPLRNDGPARPGADAARRAAFLNVVVPAMLLLGTLFITLLYVSKPSWIHDETFYYSFSTEFRRWLAAPTLDQAAVGKVFYEGSYHPPLPIYLMALTGKVFQAEEGDFLLAVRMATVVQFAALALLVYWFVKREAGAAAGAFASILTILSPRLLGAAFFAVYDMPLTLYWVAATFAFYKAIASRKWAIVSGLAFGLVLLTKENAFLLPLALWPWGLYFYRRKAVAAIISMAVIGPLVMYAFWPWLWLHPLANMFRYVADKFIPGALPQSVAAATGTAGVAWRDVIPTLYFGKADPRGVAWHYPFVMTLITMPAAAILGAGASAFAAKAERGVRPLLALLWWSVLVQLAVFAFATKPYDGVRLFLPAVELATVAAGIGLARIAARSAAAITAVTALLVLSPGAEVFIYGPYQLSYYTPLVGGLPGADRLGMEATYFGDTIDAAGFAAINDRATPGQRIAYAPMFKKNPLWMPANYIRYTFLKADLLPARPWEDWDYLIFINRGGSIEPADRKLLAEGTVIHENRLLGVMLSEILERRRNQEMEGGNAPGQH